MRYLFGEKWFLVLPLYVLSGLALGLGDPLFCEGMKSLGVKPGLATAAVVNGVLPLLAISLAIVHARVGSAIVGALGMSAAYVAGLELVYPLPQWNALALLHASKLPILVVACLGYAVLGTVAALVTRAARKSDDWATAPLP